jgi:hypothetical protein
MVEGCFLGSAVPPNLACKGANLGSPAGSWDKTLSGFSGYLTANEIKGMLWNNGIVAADIVVQAFVPSHVLARRFDLSSGPKDDPSGQIEISSLSHPGRHRIHSPLLRIPSAVRTSPGYRTSASSALSFV